MWPFFDTIVLSSHLVDKLEAVNTQKNVRFKWEPRYLCTSDTMTKRLISSYSFIEDQELWKSESWEPEISEAH